MAPRGPHTTQPIPDISECPMRLYTRDATLKQLPLYANSGEVSDNPTLKAPFSGTGRESVLFSVFCGRNDASNIPH